jgi:exopolysaccharide biosynthesis WecB/TagA/CpsF family protein
MGNSFKALEYYELMIELRDSLFNEENTRKLTRLEMQYDFDKKEAVALAEQEKKDAIALQEMKRQKLVRNGFMGGFAAMLLFGGVVFVQRNRISKEKDRSESLLLNILPAETAQELKEKGSSDAVLINQVTVLFTDFKGFTAMSEILSPKELVADLHDCFSEFDRICEKIRSSGAKLIWVGLGCPKQEHWIARHKDQLPPGVFLGIGAAFAFQAGEGRPAPPLFQRLGCEWAYRLAMEPRRLFKRYFTYNSLFLFHLLRDQMRG